MTARLLYRPEEAAAQLGVSRTRVYELIASGELASVKLGRSRRITQAALEAFVERLAELHARPGLAGIGDSRPGRGTAHGRPANRTG